METTLLNVNQIIGSRYCVRASDGELLYTQIHPLLKKGNRVVVSFQEIDLVIAAFLNSAIGKLYSVLPATLIEQNLSVSGLNSLFFNTWRKIHGIAPHYYAHQEVMHNHVKNIIEE